MFQSFFCADYLRFITENSTRFVYEDLHRGLDHNIQVALNFFLQVSSKLDCKDEIQSVIIIKFSTAAVQCKH